MSIVTGLWKVKVKCTKYAVSLTFIVRAELGIVTSLTVTLSRSRLRRTVLGIVTLA